jgi:hypothetical protein
MNHSHSASDYTSAHLEKVALSRFRSSVNFLPQDCRIFREPWDCSTILCLDFAYCPSLLEVVKGEDRALVRAAQELGLANALIFRIGNKFMGLSGMKASR